MGGQPVKDVEMDIAPSHVRTRRLARRTALRKRPVRVNEHSVTLNFGRFILGCPDRFESALHIPEPLVQ
jgi:hypothetical protein